MFDLIFKNGEIFDGTGKAGYISDIGITDGKITAIGKLSETVDTEVIDVAGLAVAPGFVDMHTHSDFTLIADGRAESQVHQGVTTEVIGHYPVHPPTPPGSLSDTYNHIFDIILFYL